MATDTTSEKYLKHEIKANNEASDIEIRKHRSRLATIGTGIMMFGVWNLVKTVGFYQVRADDYTQSLGVIIASVGTTTLLSLIVRGYVGMSALAVSRGKDKGGLYLFLARLMMLFSVLTLSILVVGVLVKAGKIMPEADTSEIHIMTIIASFIIEITSLILLVELVVSGRKLRKIAKSESGVD